MEILFLCALGIKWLKCLSTVYHLESRVLFTSESCQRDPISSNMYILYVSKTYKVSYSVKKHIYIYICIAIVTTQKQYLPLLSVPVLLILLCEQKPESHKSWSSQHSWAATLTRIALGFMTPIAFISLPEITM